jgi:16S rRNA G966 N2-methylase RsmD
MRKSKNKPAAGNRSVSPRELVALYNRPLPANRTGALYNAFPYATKIAPEAIALFIASHTRPGDTVFDGFAGSGTTGLAALLCENPSRALRDEAQRLGLDVKWGARNAVLYEIGALGAFVGRTLTNPPDPKVFRKAAEQILSEAEKGEGWMYHAQDPQGAVGEIRHVIWSDKLRCPGCRRSVTLWDACVSTKPARIASLFTCPKCGHKAAIDTVERQIEKYSDELLEGNRASRARVPIHVYGSTGKKAWSRPAERGDIALCRRIAREPIPETVPRIAIPWGDLYRSGYHEGITHLHHFYTRRNLIAFARLWQRAEKYPGALGDALRFWLLSYNASHATIMSRVVAKVGQDELVTTSAQSGVLYVSGLPVEKNIVKGLRRKLKTIALAFESTRECAGKVVVVERSSCDVSLPDSSVDYAFTDPPFGGNIPYAEVNFINEAWLNRYTDRKEEAIVSKHQEKSIQDYEALMARALKEIHRILKPKAKATVVFHSATAEIWNALQGAYKSAHFAVELTSVLDKTQGSFKQVTARGAVRGDPILLLSKQGPHKEQVNQSVWTIAEQLRSEAIRINDPSEQTPQRLYSRLVNHFLSSEQQVPLDAETFYQWWAENHATEASGAQA